MVARHLAVITPCCVVLALLPAEWWIRLLVAAFALLASTFAVAINAADLRSSRLRRHGLGDSGDPGGPARGDHQ